MSSISSSPRCARMITRQDTLQPTNTTPTHRTLERSFPYTQLCVVSAVSCCSFIRDLLGRCVPSLHLRSIEIGLVL